MLFQEIFLPCDIDSDAIWVVLLTYVICMKVLAFNYIGCVTTV